RHPPARAVPPRRMRAGPPAPRPRRTRPTRTRTGRPGGRRPAGRGPLPPRRRRPPRCPDRSRGLRRSVAPAHGTVRRLSQRATISTSMCPLEIELFDDAAPATVANFTKLAGDGFYDDLTFHRVIP